MWNAADADGGKTLARPPSVVFYHIPSPEAFNPPDTASLPRVTNPTDASTPPYPSTMTEPLIIGARHETATTAGAQSQPGIFDLFTPVSTLTTPPPAVSGC